MWVAAAVEKDLARMNDVASKAKQTLGERTKTPEKFSFLHSGVSRWCVQWGRGTFSQCFSRGVLWYFSHSVSQAQGLPKIRAKPCSQLREPTTTRHMSRYISTTRAMEQLWAALCSSAAPPFHLCSLSEVWLATGLQMVLLIVWPANLIRSMKNVCFYCYLTDKTYL